MTVCGTPGTVHGVLTLHEKRELKQDTEECCYTLSAAGAVTPTPMIDCQNTKMDVVREMSDKFKVSMNVKQQQTIYEVINMFMPSLLVFQASF